MNVETFVAAIVEFVKINEAWAVPIAFIVAFAESFCFVSIVWPGTAILAAITALLAASGADHSIVIPSIISAGLGGTLGYAFSYWIGLYFKDSIERIWPFRSRPQLLQHGKKLFSHWGGWGIFFGHFIGPVRAVIPVVSGMFQMNQLTFQIANTLSAFLWSAGIIAPSFYLVSFRDDISHLMQNSPQSFVPFLMILGFTSTLPRTALPSLLLFFVLGEAYLFYTQDFTISLFAGGIGAFIGECFAYYVGRQQNRKWKNLSPSTGATDAQEKAIAYLLKRGSVGLLLSKFSPSLRLFVPKAAGIIPLSFAKFSVISLLSCIFLAAIILSPILMLNLFWRT